MEPIRGASEFQTERDVADTREGFSVLGGRFSSPLASAEGQVKAERGANLDSLISQMFLADQGNLLNAINSMHQQGSQNVAPAFQMAGLGINPENTIVSDSPFVKGMQLFTELAKVFNPKSLAGGGAG